MSIITHNGKIPIMPNGKSLSLDSYISDLNAITGESDISLGDAIETEHDNITAAKAAITAKGGTVVAGSGSGGLASEIAGIPSGGGSLPTGIADIYYGDYTPEEDLSSFVVTHNKNNANVLLVMVWAESLGNVTPELNCTVAKYWAKTTIPTLRRGNGFSTGYAWNADNSYAATSSPNTPVYETLTIGDNSISLPKTQSSTEAVYLAGITYHAVIVFGEVQSNADT